MTKHYLAEKILLAVEAKQTEPEKIEAIKNLLDVVIPKNLGLFAQWGLPREKSTPKDCWK